MKHLVANLFHVMMTDRVDVSFFIGGGGGGRGWSLVKEKMYQMFVFSPLLQKIKTA